MVVACAGRKAHLIFSVKLFPRKSILISQKNHFYEGVLNYFYFDKTFIISTLVSKSPIKNNAGVDNKTNKKKELTKYKPIHIKYGIIN